MLSHLLGELRAGRGVPAWSALGFWLSVVVMVAVAGVLDVSFKRRTGCRGYSMSLSKRSIPPVAEVTASWISAWPSGLLSAATAVS